MNNKELIEGGKADGISSDMFDKNEINKGIKVEMEHTDNPELAQEIAEDHEIEGKITNEDGKYDNEYYDKLDILEKSIEDNKNIEIVDEKFAWINSLDELIKNSN